MMSFEGARECDASLALVANQGGWVSADTGHGSAIRYVSDSVDLQEICRRVGLTDFCLDY